MGVEEIWCFRSFAFSIAENLLAFCSTDGTDDGNEKQRAGFEREKREKHEQRQERQGAWNAEVAVDGPMSR